jgi:2',3'-cyclic-nucleotide 2'-phosphodiesterase (5'-nucleotidase family)
MNYFYKSILWIGFLFFVLGCRVQHFAYSENKTIEVGGGENTVVEKILNPYRLLLESQMNDSIGFVPLRLTMGRPESSLGNWFADTQQKASEALTGKKIDFAVSNSGGIRIPEIPKGSVTTGKIFELMPFDNLLVLMELSGVQTMQLIQHIAKSGGWPVSSGLRFKINSEGKAVDVLINGEAFEISKHYMVSLSDYVATGGSDCSFLIGIPYENTGILIRDALIFQIKKESLLEAKMDGRISKI